MTQQKSVSLPDEQVDFAENRGLSLSKILQNELEKRMENQTIEATA